MISDWNSLLDFLEEHKFAILFHLTFLFGLSLWALKQPQPQPQPGTAASVTTPAPPSSSSSSSSSSKPSVMAGFAPKEPVNLAPPKDDPITVEELALCDGKHEGKPIYVAIKGTVFDVSAKTDMYGPGAGYNVFAGKDASRGLGKSSLNPEDAVSDYSTLTPEEMKVLDDWYTYFSKRYNIVGKVVTGSTGAKA